MTNNPTIDGVSLLSCPFCGGKPNKQRSSGDERDGYADCVSYVCSGCGCAKGAKGDTSKGGYADNSKIEAQAVAAWNSRTESPEVAALQSTIAQLQARIAELELGLGGMLFAFDDGVGRGWSAKTLDYARKLTPAVEFDATAALNKP